MLQYICSAQFRNLCNLGILKLHANLEFTWGHCAISRLRIPSVQSRDCATTIVALSRDCVMLFGIPSTCMYLVPRLITGTFFVLVIFDIWCPRNWSNTHYTAMLLLNGAEGLRWAQRSNTAVSKWGEGGRDDHAKDESCKRSLAATNAGIPPSSAREQEAAYQPESHATCVRSKLHDQDCAQVLRNLEIA